jgi:SAM-dependent methyltransferase
VEHGHSHLAVGWGPKNRQATRFEILASPWDFAGKRILDIGGGFGDLYGYLAPRGIAHYTGVDIVPDLVAVGRRAYGGNPNFELIQGDFLELELEAEYDLAFISGLFNFKLAQGGNYEFISQVLGKAMGLCSEGVSANFITARTDFQEDIVFYADERIVLETCFHLTRRLSMRADYFPFEYSVHLHKDDSYSTVTSTFLGFRGTS